MKIGKKIFILIFVFQLIMPMVLCVKGIDNEIHYDERAKEIKVKVSLIEFDIGTQYDEVRIFIKDNTYDTDEYINGGYFSFENDDEGYYNLIHTRGKPKTDYFIADKEGGYGLSWYQKIKTEKYKFITDIVDEYYWLTFVELYTDEPYFYDEYSDRITITEPPAEAYAVLMVYKGRYEVKDVYIDGLQIDQYIENLANGTPDRQKDLENLEKRIEEYKQDREYGYDYDTALDDIVMSVLGDNYTDEDYDKIMEYAKSIIDNGEADDIDEMVDELTAMLDE